MNRRKWFQKVAALFGAVAGGGMTYAAVQPPPLHPPVIDVECSPEDIARIRAEFERIHDSHRVWIAMPGSKIHEYQPVYSADGTTLLYNKHTITLK